MKKKEEGLETANKLNDGWKVGHCVFCVWVVD